MIRHVSRWSLRGPALAVALALIAVGLNVALGIHQVQEVDTRVRQVCELGDTTAVLMRRIVEAAVPRTSTNPDRQAAVDDFYEQIDSVFHEHEDAVGAIAGSDCRKVP